MFTDAYKLAIVAEYDAATEHGARGALLRREGLYDSHIGKWRRAREAGRLSGNGTPAPAKAAASLRRENERLRAQVEALTTELDSTKAVLDIVGKVSVCAVAQARSGLKMGIWSPADVVAPWSLEAVEK